MEILKKNYLIAIDLDETLVTNFNNDDNKSLELLKEIAKYNYVVIATGRPLRSSLYYYKLLGLNTPIINYNGALVHHPFDPNFPKSYISVKKEWVEKIIDDNSYIVNIFCEIEDEIFLYKKQDEINPYLHLDGGKLHIGPFKDTLYGDPNGAIIFSTLGSGEMLEQYINEEFKGKLKIRFWGCENYTLSEVYNPLTTKGNGIKRIIDYYNIDFSKTIAIADGHNDIELFNEVNIKVAMGNSHPELLKMATFVTSDIHHHGVYEFLYEFFCKQKD